MLTEYYASDRVFKSRTKWKRLPIYVYYYDKDSRFKYRIMRKVDGELITFGYFSKLYEAQAMAEAMFYGSFRERHHKCRAVQCRETGKVFESLKAAADYYNMDRTGLSFHLRGKQSHFNNLTWEYYEEN
jgi:hypothetical protein